MRKAATVAALAVVIGVAVAPLAPAGSAVGGAQVLMVDNEPDLTNWHFDPADVTVTAGSTVVWHHKGHEEHSVTADDKSFDSGLTKPGTDFTRVFPKVGAFTYHCQPHPWMTGKVRVVAADASAASASTTTATTAATTTTTGAAAPPATQAPGGPAAGGATTAPSRPGAGATGASGAPPAAAPGATEAAPAANRSHSGHHLPGTIAIVLGPTLAGLALGARLRRSTSRQVRKPAAHG